MTADDFLLYAGEKRRKDAMTVDRAEAILQGYRSHPELAKVAETAIHCVEERGADVRLMAVLLERMEDGAFIPLGQSGGIEKGKRARRKATA